MASESIKLGISISRDKIRFIEAEEWNGKINVTSVVQTTLPQMFDFSIIGDENIVPQFSSLIDKALENFNDKISSARICVDRRLAIKKTFAADKNLSEGAIRKHIEWELEQALIAPRDEYNVGFEHVSMQNSKNDVVAFAAIRKALVKYIEDIFKKSRLTLESIDLDLFASIRALNQAYADKLKGVSAMIDLSTSGIGYAILVDGLYAVSTEKSLAVDDSKFAIEDLPANELATKINEELKQLVEYLEEELNVSNLDRIFIGGEKAEREFVAKLQKLQLAASVEIVEPFNNVHRQLNIESQMLIDEQASSFMSCFGMIL